MNIKILAEKYNDYIINRRRFYHSIPELSFEEINTTKEIAKDLKSLGIEVETFPDYSGLVCTIKGKSTGKTLLLRAAIDALPLYEHTDLPYAASSDKMHASGHDADISMLLGAAKIISEMKDELQGTVKLLFQAAAESAHGAEYYVEKGVLDNVDAVFGLHILGTLDAPYFNLQPGIRMASIDSFKIKVRGVSSHGASPHLGKDAIIAASAIIMNIQTLASRINSPLNPLVVSIGTITGGIAYHTIANNVEMEGTTSTYSREARTMVEEKLREIIERTANSLGCQAELEYSYYASPIINEHEDINKIVKSAAINLYGEESLIEMPKLMGLEDFAYLMEKVPGFYGFIGTKNEAKGYIYPNHNDKFTIDENVLHRGAALYAQFAFDFLSQYIYGGDLYD